MELVVLGSGDTVGVPKIGCSCPTCTIAKEKGIPDARTRFSILIKDTEAGFNMLVDTSPDMRLQLIREGVERVSAVLYTHHHWDHVLGFNDFYRVQAVITVFGLKETVNYVLDRVGFGNLVKAKRKYIHPFESVKYKSIEFTAFPVYHPHLNDGLNIQPVGYMFRLEGAKLVVTGDTGISIPEESLKLIHEPDILITDAFISYPKHFLDHHMTIEEAVRLAEQLEAKKTILVHLTHANPPHAELQKKVDLTAEKIIVGYDTLKLKI